MRMWLYAMNKVIVSRKGGSTLQLNGSLVSHQSAWRMLYNSFGYVERRVPQYVWTVVDTCVGGAPRKQNRLSEGESVVKRKRGRGTSKTPVIGVKERHTSKIHAVVGIRIRRGSSWGGSSCLVCWILFFKIKNYAKLGIIHFMQVPENKNSY